MTSRRPFHTKPDHSVLRPSIEVSNSGMKQAIYAMKCGSKEVKTAVFLKNHVIPRLQLR